MTARLPPGLGSARLACETGRGYPMKFAKPMVSLKSCSSIRTFVKELDSNEISDVMRRMFVRATKTSFTSQQTADACIPGNKAYHDGWSEIR